MLIAEQIERARAAAGDTGDADGSESRSASPEPVGLLQRDETSGPLKLSFGVKKAVSPSNDEASASSSSTTTTPPAAETSSSAPSTASTSTAVPTPQPAMKFNAFKKSAVPAKTNPLKMNVFKTAKATSSATSSEASSSVKRPREEMPAAQRLILEDQERKKRRIGAV